MARKRVVIVGGVAGGASCAARLRRLDEEAEILIFDRGHYVSFANCGLPYFVGNVIREESKLLLASADLFRDRFNIEVRLRNEVVSIDRQSQQVIVRDLDSQREYREPYDALVLSPGASPIRPPLPGIDLPGIFTLRSLPDSVDIRDWIDLKKPQRAVVVGGGFIGLEMAENLVRRGMDVTIVEMADQLMPPVDPEMAEYVRRHVATHVAHLQLNDGVAGSNRRPAAAWSSSRNQARSLTPAWSCSPSGCGRNPTLRARRVSRSATAAAFASIAGCAPAIPKSGPLAMRWR